MRFLVLVLLVISCASNKKEKTPAQKKAEIHYNQGTKELVNKDYTSALTHLIEANALSPDDARILNNLGMAYYFKGSTDRGIRYIKRSLEVNPKNTDARLNLATIYMNRKNYSEAEKQYKTILEDLTYPKQQRTHYNLGVLYSKQGLYRQAFDQFNKSLKIDETYCPANFQLGLTQYKQRNFKRAYEFFKDASLGECYKLPEPQFYQALSLIKINNLPLARLKFEEIAERFPRSDYARKSLQYLNRFPQIISKQAKKSQNL